LAREQHVDIEVACLFADVEVKGKIVNKPRTWANKACL